MVKLYELPKFKRLYHQNNRFKTDVKNDIIFVKVATLEIK